MPDSPPRIITARKLGLRFVDLFGQLGPERNVTGHYSAGPRAQTWRDGIARARQFHAEHAAKGWGGIAYHFVIADDGALICARPTILKGAHVGLHNTDNLGVNCPGTTGDRPTAAQRDTYRWLLAHAHTDALPAAHRTDLDLSQASLFGHNSWSGHETNGCPGLMKGMFRAGLSRAPEEEPEPPVEGEAPYPQPVEIGGIQADHRHVAPEEAEQAARSRTRGPEEGTLPEEDPDFDEEAALRGAVLDDAAVQ